MKPEVLIVGPLMERVERALDDLFVTHRLYRAADREAFLAEVGARVRGVATTGFDGADAAMIDAMPNLEIISCYGVGVDAIDIPHATSRGVVVTNTPGVLNECVADLAIGLMIAVARGVSLGDRYVRDGKWLHGNMRLMSKVSGKTVGVLGLGRIGKAIARRAAAFDCPILYYGRNRQDVPHRYYDDLVAMAADSDFLIAICPGGAETAHLVNDEVMNALGPEGVLINVARGSVVDETALVAALKEGRLGGAGLDVYKNEPNAPPALFDMDNVVLQPHQASATNETRWAMGALTIENLALKLAGEPVKTPVNAV